MIVSDKQKTLLLANELSNQILLFISRESYKIHTADPAELIYLGCHIVGALLYKAIVSFDNYSQIYNIPHVSETILHKLIIDIAAEYKNGLINDD